MLSRKPRSLVRSAGVALVAGAFLAAGLAGGCGGGSPAGTAASDDRFLDETVIAEVGSYKVTARDLDQRLLYQFPELHGVYSASNERSIREILGVDIDHLCLISEAERVGYPDSSVRFRQNMEVARRQILQKDYVEDIIHTAAQPTEAEVLKAYEERKEQFRQPARAIIRHILVATEGEARAAMARIQQGTPFAQLATEITTHEPSRRAGGAVGYVQRGRPVETVGEVPELVDAALSMEEGTMRVVKTALGWHVLRVDRQIPEGYAPFSEVREQIAQSMFRTVGTMVLDSTLRALRVKFNTRLNDEALAAYMAWRRAGAESDVFEKAQNEPDPEKRIAIYEEYIRHFGHSEHACQARFLVAFTLAEELKDPVRARPKLREFLEQCPESELADDARMLMESSR